MIVEEKLIQHLKKELGVPVYVVLPAKLPFGNFIVIDKTGSSETELVYRCTFAVQSYGMTMEQTIELNHQVIEAMKKLVEEPEFSAVDFDTDYNYTDPDLKRYRYQAIFHLVFF